MKIALVHNSYQQLGGEDAVVLAEKCLLESGGHHVSLHTVSNNRINSVGSRAKALLNTAYSPAGAAFMRAIIEVERPDVVHVHNFFPLLSPAIHEVAAMSRTAVVQTLHNYRLVCAAGTFLRHGNVCEACISDGPWRAIAHRCYRGSVAGSAAVVAMQRRARKHNTWRSSVHRFIALTEFARERFVGAGFPSDRIVVKSNFCPTLSSGGGQVREGCLYVGRLSPEKGLDVAIEAFRRLPNIQFTIVGDGPERTSLESSAPQNVNFLGSKSSSEVAMLMTKARLLVMPSISYETFGMTIIEAYAAGLPVVASNRGAMAELVSQRTGELFQPGDSDNLALVIEQLLGDEEQMRQKGVAAREEHAARFSPEVNLRVLERVYSEALNMIGSG